jgi:hypothetical protein
MLVRIGADITSSKEDLADEHSELQGIAKQENQDESNKNNTTAKVATSVNTNGNGNNDDMVDE